MKRLLLLVTISLPSLLVSAQNYDAIKLTLSLTQFEKAKEEVDKSMSNTKFASKPEAYILKASIYGGLAMDPKNINTAKEDELTTDGNNAFSKFREMDPSMSLLKEEVYQMGIDNLYRSNYNLGYNAYNEKKWEPAFKSLKSAMEYSDLLIEKKILPGPIDTNLLILAGVTAENGGFKDDAAKYYTKLADSKITGDGFESVYRFLVTYYFGKKDMANFEKYKGYGGEMYPKSEYFKYDKIDFAVGLMENFNDKLKALDEVLATDPGNYKANQILGELIYDTLNSDVEGAVLPPNADEMEAKMVKAFNNSATAKPGSEIPYIYIADHFINKAAKAGEVRDAHTKAMKAKAKPGVKPDPADVAKKEELEKKYGDALETAREPYEKAAAILAAKPKGVDKNQDIRDRGQYKKACSYLSDIYAYKKSKAKPNTPEFTKWETEEKKWMTTYEGIK
ncbi:MAG: hypothetical protein JNM88_15395 [Chitinophagaceae bacterium]|nr:hypothetical protein [Chitinophagaceae bacterium]